MGRVEELFPEPDQVGLLHLTSLEDAVQLEVSLPVHLHILVLNIDSCNAIFSIIL